MSFWTDLRLPCEQELLIGFYDLKGYSRQAEASAPLALLELMSGYFALTGKMIGEQGGRLIKTLGDAGLVAFDALLEATREADPATEDPLYRRAWLHDGEWINRLLALRQIDVLDWQRDRYMRMCSAHLPPVVALSDAGDVVPTGV